MQLLAQFNASHLFLLGLLATSAVILFQAQRRMKLSMTPAAPNARRLRAAATQQRQRRSAAPAELGDWKGQMHEFALDVSSRVDAQLAALEQLTRAARHESLRLEAAIAQAQSLAGQPAAAVLPPAVGYAPPRSQARALEEAARGLERPLPEPPLRKQAAPQRPVGEIYALADAGLRGRDIAERVGAPVGEVELILGLRASA
jgi:hypothetical protein